MSDIDIKLLFKEINSFGFSLSKQGPNTAYEDENKIVHVLNSNGFPIMMMHRNDWDDLIGWSNSTD